ncbi:MAG: porin family protein [Pseudolabrys sp.]|nr:porin family protein [Pseudolabrys sp.]
MRKLFLGLSFALFATGAAAADRWTGFYVGGNLGMGSARANADYSILGIPAFTASENLDGLIYGAQLGYNKQWGRFVLGVEGDIQGTTQKATASRTCLILICGIGLTQTSDDSIPWLATLRGRVGIAHNNFLFYATAGMGVGEFKSTQTVTTLLGTVIAPVDVGKKPALVLGGGVEAALSAHWSMKFEYLYFETPSFRTDYPVAGIGPFSETSRMTEQMLRVGLNYRF